MDSLDSQAVNAALLELHAIGALNDDQSLSDIGKLMRSFPLPAQYGRVLVAASENDILLEAIDAICLLYTEEEVFRQPTSDEEREATAEARSDLVRREGDILTYLTTMQKYIADVGTGGHFKFCKDRAINHESMKRALQVRKQLRGLCRKNGTLTGDIPRDPQPFLP
jgi:ATP-dependent RNA helicase DHR2